MKRALISTVTAAVSAVLLDACCCFSHPPPPPPPPPPRPMNRPPPPPPPPPQGIGVEQAKGVALQFAANQGFSEHFVWWVRDHGDKWEIRIHARPRPGFPERRMTVWVDHGGNVPQFGEVHPGPGWGD